MKLLLLSLIFIVSCGPKENPCGYTRHDIPFTLNIHESFPDDAIPALKRSIQSWNDAAGKELIRLGDRIYGPVLPRQDTISVLYWMSSWELDKPTEQGRTSTYWTPTMGNPTIFESDIRINALNFTYDQSKPRWVDLESLLTHEIGHSLGLLHNDSTPSVMATYLSMNTIRRTLTQADIDQIQCRYK